MDLREKKTFGYRERDEAARAAFLEAFQADAPADVVYMVDILTGVNPR